jgi:hypothetical protein
MATPSVFRGPEVLAAHLDARPAFSNCNPVEQPLPPGKDDVTQRNYRESWTKRLVAVFSGRA